MRVLPLLLTAPLILLVASCGTETDVDGYEPSIGSNARSDSVEALGFAAVTDGEGAATVVGSLLNEGPRAGGLVEASVDAESGPVETVLSEGPLALPPGESVQLATMQAITLRSDVLRPGFFVELTMRFQRSEPITMLIPVEPQQGPYAEIEVAAPPDGDVSP